MNRELIQYATENAKIYLDESGNDHWKIPVAIVCQMYGFFLNAKEYSIDRIRNLDPWDYEAEIVEITEQLEEYDRYLDSEDIMQTIAEHWGGEKIDSILFKLDPLTKAFNEQDFKRLDGLSGREKQNREYSILKNICETLAKTSESFYLPTRKVANGFKENGINRSHQNIALKIKTLERNNFIIKVTEGNTRQSPRYKLKTENSEIVF